MCPAGQTPSLVTLCLPESWCPKGAFPSLEAHSPLLGYEPGLRTQIAWASDFLCPATGCVILVVCYHLFGASGFSYNGLVESSLSTVWCSPWAQSVETVGVQEGLRD